MNYSWDGLLTMVVKKKNVPILILLSFLLTHVFSFSCILMALLPWGEMIFKKKKHWLLFKKERRWLRNSNNKQSLQLPKDFLGCLISKMHFPGVGAKRKGKEMVI